MISMSMFVACLNLRNMHQLSGQGHAELTFVNELNVAVRRMRGFTKTCIYSEAEGMPN